MFVYNDAVSELRRNMTYVSISTVLFTDLIYFYCIIFVFTWTVKLRMHLLFALNVIEFQLQMSGNYFLMLCNPKDRITYMFYYCCQTVKILWMHCFIDLYDLLFTYILIWMLDNDASYHYTHLLCTFRIPKCDLGFLNTV